MLRSRLREAKAVLNNAVCRRSRPRESCAGRSAYPAVGITKSRGGQWRPKRDGRTRCGAAGWRAVNSSVSAPERRDVGASPFDAPEPAPPGDAAAREAKPLPLQFQSGAQATSRARASIFPNGLDARDAGLAAQPVEGGQDCAQIIRLIEAKIAKREDERADDGGRDLDDEPHRRVRRRAVARRCFGWGRAPFLAPAKRARLGIAVSLVGDRQRAARNGALGPPAAGAMERRTACSRAES